MGLRLTGDFEGRSEAPLRKVGAYRYSTDPSTEIICFAYTHAENDGHVRVWIAPDFIERFGIEMGYHSCETEDGLIEAVFTDNLDEFEEWLSQADTFEAHNAFFERCMWRNKFMPEFGVSDIPNHKWRCSAAKAAVYALPRSLEGAGSAMLLDDRKDKEGSKLLSRLMKPMPERQQKKHGKKYHESKEEIIRLALYCAQDVKAEETFSHKLPDLIPFEQRVWEVDQDANERGVYCDIDLVNHILEMCDQKVSQYSEELFDVTEGYVSSVGARKKLLEWLDIIGQGDLLEDTKAASIDAILERDDIDPIVYRALEIVRKANRTSTRKYVAMQMRINEDQRIRDTLMYHGANTGRWSGRGVQFQNLMRGMIKDMEVECDFISKSELWEIELIYDDAMELFGSAVRGAISAPEGRELIVADYSSIEARGAPWAAGDEDALDIFRQGKDIYLDMASTIYGYEVTKEMSKKRQLGKQAILGLGYGMGAHKFLITCWGYNIYFDHKEMLPLVKDYDKIKKAVLRLPQIYFKDEVTQEEHMDDIIIAKFIVDSYRKKYSKLVKFWADCEDAAMRAVYDFQGYQDARKALKEAKQKALEASQTRKTKKARDNNARKADAIDKEIEKLEERVRQAKAQKGRWHKAGVVKYKVLGRFLFCQLPSGRRLAYPYPYIRPKMTAWGKMKETIHFMGVGDNRKWCTQTTYGGKLVENIVQAIARDLMANAMVAVDDDPIYDIVLTVHDEIVTEVDEGKGSVKEFEALISELPDWAEGFPLAAEGWRGKRYRK